ncbi:MAG: hypothetical protein ACYTGC_00905 [Planctomycetota bacterium]
MNRARGQPIVLLLLLGTLALSVGGCGTYTLRGKVVAGDFSTMAFVSPDDPRLQGPGLPNVQIRLYRDPGTLGTEMVAQGLSDGVGAVNIPVGAFGAGWLVEQWRISATRSGYQTSDVTMSLPGGGENKQLLIMLAPGISPPYEEDLMEQYRRFGG